jgi:hypothetical protein
MYSGAEYDEFQTFKYMMAKHILNGQMYPVEVAAVTTANMKSIVADIKGVSNDMEFMKTKYNLTGVKTKSMKNEQYILVNTKFDAVMDVEVLASAFNMDKAQFMGQRVLIDSFGGIDNERLAILFAGDPTYVALTEAELTALDAIPAVILDKDWFMVFDNYQNFTEQYNGEGLYWNYWYHVWKTFSVSPFANNAMFIPATPSVTSITLSPATASVATGQTATFKATVVTANFAPKAVTWSINSTKSTISDSGVLTVGADETAETITVTATSVFDNTKTGTATVTVA